MWPFRNKATVADRTIEIWDDAVGRAAEKWLYFSKALVFKMRLSFAKRYSCSPSRRSRD
jgi:hypothetical protein